MRNKLTYIALLSLLALVLTACGTAAAAQGTSTEPTPRTLNVTGSAKVYLTPDIAYVTIGVHTENEDPQEAVASNNAQSVKVHDAIVALGVDKKDVQTANFSIYPSQQYTPDGQLKGTTYMVDNSLYVTVRDLSKIGDILGAAIGAGANSISGVSFDVADKDAALSQVRQDAVEDAQATAEELAKAAGVTLGQIMTINYYGGYPTPVFEGKGGGGAMAEAPEGVPISPGQMTISADVNITYEIQ